MIDHDGFTPQTFAFEKLFVCKEGVDFGASEEAREWLEEFGYSVGYMQGPSPRGILKGFYAVQKWRNLSNGERNALDGIMVWRPRPDVEHSRCDDVIVKLREAPCESREEEIRLCAASRELVENRGDLDRLYEALRMLAGVAGPAAKSLRQCYRIMIDDEEANAPELKDVSRR